MPSSNAVDVMYAVIEVSYQNVVKDTAFIAIYHDNNIVLYLALHQKKEGKKRK